LPSRLHKRILCTLLNQVSASEERICQALEREAQSESTSDSQSAILVDIGLELGLDLDRNRGALFEQLQLLRRELVDSRDHAQLQLLETIERMFQSWTHEPAGVPHWHTIAAESADDDPLTPFDTFLCPLTKQVRVLFSLCFCFKRQFRRNGAIQSAKIVTFSCTKF